MRFPVHTGASSWTSEAWWGRFYPSDLPEGERLRWYAERYDAVEVDSTYYAIPAARMVSRWAERTPERFRFTLKMTRELLDPKTPLDAERVGAFLSHARLLGPKLAAVLLQFPPWFRPGRGTDRLFALLGLLDPGLRYAVELRDRGWFDGAEGERLLRHLAERNVALCWSYLTYVEVPPAETTDFLYLRFIGDHTTVPAERHGEVRVDRSEAIRTWADRLLSASERIREAWVFFNNHFAGFAPASINDFRHAVGLPPIPFAPERASAPLQRTLPGAEGPAD